MALTPATQALLDTLPHKRRAFVLEYAQHGNASRAMIAAGFSERTAARAAPMVLKSIEVQAALDAVRTELAAPVLAEAEVTVERLVNELAAVAFTTLPEVVEWGPDHWRVVPSDQLTPWQRSAIKKVSLKRRREVTGARNDPEVWEYEQWSVELNDKLKAVEQLGEHLGLTPPKPASGNTYVDARSIQISPERLRELRELLG